MTDHPLLPFLEDVALMKALRPGLKPMSKFARHAASARDACRAIALAFCAAIAAADAHAAPTVSLTAGPTSVSYGSSTVLNWSSTEATLCSIPWGSSATSGNYTTPSLFSNTTYTITCYGPAGSNSGSVTVNVAAPPPPPTVTLVADPATVPMNSSTALSWSSTNATSCNTPWGATGTSGAYVTPPITYERTFTVTCSGYGGSNASYVVLRIGAAAPPAVPTVTLTANPTSVAYGASSTLIWGSTNASACSTPWGSTAINGSYITPGLTATTTFSVTCSGSGGSPTASATVTVAAPPPPAVPTVTLVANPASIAYGATSTLNWGSTSTTSCTTPWGSTATSGAYTTPALAMTTSYAVTCNGSGGTQTANATVAVAAQVPMPPTPPTTGPAVTLTANPAAASYGGTTVITWSSTSATYCSVPWGSSATSGSYTTPSLFSNSTYTITCYGPAGNKAGSVTVAVGGPPPAPVVAISANPTTVAMNGMSVLTWSSTNATSCNTPWGATASGGTYTVPGITYDRTFTVTCSGYAGSNAASVTVRLGATPPPPAATVTLVANPASVAYGASSVLTWGSTNATACTTPWGSTATSGSYATSALTSTTTFTVACTGGGASGNANATVVVAAQVTETNPPLIFNATSSAAAGDVVSLQGDNFGDAPYVYLESAPGTALQIINRVSTNWLAVQIPATAPGALVLRVRNATGTSAPVKLNAARPLHLDAIQMVAGGAVRLFGRNLLLPGSTPSVTIGGMAATIDLARSNAHMLSLTVPTALPPTGNAVVLVNNGNGSGPAQLDRAIEVVAAPTTGSMDPFALGVGWAAGFAELATRTINAATDSRLSPRVVCNGTTDDSPAIQQAIQLAGNLGGAVVQLPAGRCRVAGGMNMQSKVVVQGAGKTQTELLYESNYPVFGVGLDLVGVRNLALTNAGTSREGPLLKQSSRVFLQNVRIKLGTSSQMFLDGNRSMVIAGSDFVQTGSINHQGPYILNDAAGLVFEGNTTQWVEGAPTFGRVHDSYVQGNRFTRDGSAQNLPGVVHSLTIDFAHRIAVVGNTFDVINGPINSAGRNDGETILTEAGGAQRTENIGTVGSATSQTLTDTTNTLVTDPFGYGYIPENYGVAIVGGKGAGQTRRVVAYANGTVTVERAWDVVPDGSSKYATFVWGLEKSLIKGNILSQNPRGIWLYQAAVRDVDIIGNTITEGGGIYLRSYQNLAAKRFIPIYNVLIAQNTVKNTTGLWMSYVNAVFVNSDARAFGIANLGIEMRANQVTANIPNRSSQSEEYANTEGYMNMMRVENYSGYESSPVPRMLGTILMRNSCTNCDVAVRVGTGAGGTSILDTQLFSCPVLWSDSPTTSSGERSVGTVVR